MLPIPDISSNSLATLPPPFLHPHPHLRLRLRLATSLRSNVVFVAFALS